MMKILFIGDISGEDGIRAIKDNVKSIIKNEKIDYVIANAENTTDGRGLNFTDYKKLMEYGINFFTMGNHTWKQKDCKIVLSEQNIIRPANLSKDFEFFDIGVGSKEILFQNKKIRITNLLGKSLNFKDMQTNPFHKMDEILKEDKSDIHIVDFHSETTSEKNAFFLNFKGKVDAILCTHTHVQTADEKIRDKTAYISDVGMTGSESGIIGAKPETIIQMFKEEIQFFKLAPNLDSYQFSAVILEFKNNEVIGIKRILKYEK
ncbi:MAG: TIGR00282 family metallophosphoesterase [Mycoplasmoidaceae bacterium]